MTVRRPALRISHLFRSRWTYSGPASIVSDHISVTHIHCGTNDEQIDRCNTSIEGCPSKLPLEAMTDTDVLVEGPLPVVVVRRGVRETSLLVSYHLASDSDTFNLIALGCDSDSPHMIPLVSHMIPIAPTRYRMYFSIESISSSWTPSGRRHQPPETNSRHLSCPVFQSSCSVIPPCSVIPQRTTTRARAVPSRVDIFNQ